jgi:hypothetical protein
LRHLSISDSTIWRHDLEAALATTSHSLETLEILAGVRFLDALTGKEGPFCRSLKRLVLTASGYQYRSSNNFWLPWDNEDVVMLPTSTALPVSFFRFAALETLWLLGSNELSGLTESAVVEFFRGTPRLRELRVFAQGDGGARFQAAAFVGLLKGLAQFCPQLERISLGGVKGFCIVPASLDGALLRRFADALPRMKEVAFFVHGRFPPEDWLYAIAVWAPTLEIFTAHFRSQAQDLEAERQLLALAAAPNLYCLECASSNRGIWYNEEVRWMRAQSAAAFQS